MGDMAQDDAAKCAALFEPLTADLERRDSLTFEELVELISEHAELSSEQFKGYLPEKNTPVTQRMYDSQLEVLEEDGLLWLEPIISALSHLVIVQSGQDLPYCYRGEFFRIVAGYFSQKLR